MTLSEANIITITQGGILYRDEQDVVQWLDFARCNRNWMRCRQNLSLDDFRCVGRWHHFPTYFEFCTNPTTRFDIHYTDEETIDDIDRKLRKPLLDLGEWHMQYVVI